MTYCVAMSVDEGLVGLADSLITSGREKTTQRKVSVYSPPEGGTFFVMTSGLRSVRDKTLTYLEEALADHDPPLERLYQAVNLLAAQVRRVALEDKASLAESGMRFNIHALVGGQMTRDPRQKLYLLYPEGNWVDTGDPTPYHIIGSTGYGKPILDRALKSEDSMRHAFKVACLSFDSTASPIASQLAFNAWPGYVQAFIFVGGVGFLATETDRIRFFFESVPFLLLRDLRGARDVSAERRKAAVPRQATRRRHGAVPDHGQARRRRGSPAGGTRTAGQQRPRGLQGARVRVLRAARPADRHRRRHVRSLRRAGGPLGVRRRAAARSRHGARQGDVAQGPPVGLPGRHQGRWSSAP